MESYINFNVDQGADWSAGFTLSWDDGSPVDISNSTFQSLIRNSYYTPNVTSNIVVTLVDASNGSGMLSMNAFTTSNIVAGKYVYDVVMTDSNGYNTRILQGIVNVTPGVTINDPYNSFTI